MWICEWCQREFKRESDLGNHITKSHLSKDEQFVKLSDKTILDIKNKELKEYLNSQSTCEICGRTVDEVVRYRGKYRSKRLCIDHDHTTNHFRGLLCQACNRQLGWYEKYKDIINNYIDNK